MAFFCVFPDGISLTKKDSVFPNGGTFEILSYEF